jgi:hypothetical protein
MLASGLCHWAASCRNISCRTVFELFVVHFICAVYSVPLSLPVSIYLCSVLRFLIAFYHVSLSSGVSYWRSVMNGEHSINIMYKIQGLDVSGPHQRGTV